MYSLCNVRQSFARENKKKNVSDLPGRLESCRDDDFSFSKLRGQLINDSADSAHQEINTIINNMPNALL